MWILTMRVWQARRKNRVSHEYDHITERLETLATRLPLSEALQLIKRRQDELDKRYEHSKAEYNLLAITEIPNVTDMEALRALGVTEINQDFATSVQDE